jgi:predicted TIM-barrel fold metal-dependent hydrolase
MGLKLLKGFCALMVLAGCAQGPLVRKRSELVPRADHHQHLMSAAAITPPEPPLPAIRLPEELERLLRRRGEISGSTAPTEVFTEDSQILRINQGDWVRGTKAVHEFLGFVAKGIRYVPNAYEVGGSTGYIAGTIQLGEPAKDVLNFLLALRRGADGTWRISAESATLKPPPAFQKPVTAEQLIEQLDDARIPRAVVLSLAYWYGGRRRTDPLEIEYPKVQAENDWTVQEAARFPDRLIPFCSVNPLKPYALQELARCAKMPTVKGVKLHFGNSGIDVQKPEHLEPVRRFFRAANEHRLAIVAHLWFSGGSYGPEHSRIFLEQVLPEAPDITVQIAHLAGAGPGYGPDEALAVFAEAMAAGDPRTRNLYFDTASNVTEDESPETCALIAKRLRQLGLERVLYGSDLSVGTTNPPPAAAWATTRRRLPLTDEELRTLANNVPPYLR